mmetsp:Transcript_4173/g.4874  ORF Transcript_4173/g.4874 Transcript_4173/m.4874 type:complete len:234 (+) Transcript_4173:97-798(+)
MLYFSAQWCPPCRQFTPLLRNFYETLRDNNKNVEIVFVSSDNSEDAMMSYFEGEHGDYLAVKYGDPAQSELGKELNVKGIPSLFVVDKSGKPVVDATICRRAVMSGKPLDYIDEWRKAAGDWVSRGGGKKLGSKNTNINAAPKSREELRKARLAAMQRRQNGTKNNETDGSTAPDYNTNAESNKPKVQSRSSIPPLDKVELLSSMGFSVLDSKNALEATNDDFDTALEILLNK